METVETTMTYMDIIAEARSGDLLIWGHAQAIPEIKRKPDDFVGTIRYWMRLGVRPNFQDKIIFLMRDIRHMCEDDELREEFICLIPGFARGLNNLKETYAMHKETKKPFSTLTLLLHTYSSLPHERDAGLFS